MILYYPLYHKIYQSTMGFLSSILHIIYITKSTNQPGFLSSNHFLCFTYIILYIIYIIKSTNQPGFLSANHFPFFKNVICLYHRYHPLYHVYNKIYQSTRLSICKPFSIFFKCYLFIL